MGAALFLHLGQVGDQSLGGEEHRCDGRSVLQRRARDLRRVDDAQLVEIAVLAGRRVEAEGVLAPGPDLAHDQRAVEAGVFRDAGRRGGECVVDDLDAELLVVTLELEAVEHGVTRADERHAAARQDALLDGGARRVQRVLHPRLLLFHLALGGRADRDLRACPSLHSSDVTSFVFECR